MYKLHVVKTGDAWFGAALGEDDTIIATGFTKKRRQDVLTKILEDLPSDAVFTEEEKLEGTAQELLRNMYLVYEGKPTEREFTFDMKRISPFHRKALKVTFNIPRGYVATYGSIAEALGKPGAARAVGTAEATNPFAPIIPCHRVVAASLKLGGYGGGLIVKRAILEREGVMFERNRVSRKSLWTPPPV